MTYDAFETLVARLRAEGATRLLVPVYRRRSADLLTPVSAFLALRQEAPYGFLLESVEGGEKLARYSFLGRAPHRIVRARGRRVEVEERRGGGFGALNGQAPQGSIFDVLQAYLTGHTEAKVPGLPRFTGGAVGYLGYDAVRLLEHLPSPPPDDLGLPDAVWAFYDTVVAFDHVRHQLVLMAHVAVEEGADLEEVYAAATARLDALERDLARPAAAPPAAVTLEAEAPTSNFDRAAFEAAVAEAKRHIHEGDIFQVVLSQRFAMPFRGDRFNLYRALRQVNPSPYLFYLDFAGFALVGSSPEVLVRAENGRAELLPIAGTRPRGATGEEDALLEAELLADPKERAEHVMLIDLGRNDVGRIARPGSVNVPVRMSVERFSHVMHIVSEVSGELAAGRGPWDVLAATFPAGTLTGAPKLRAMQIIRELERRPRRVYGGAIGYVSAGSDLDFAIAIRTAVLRNGRFEVTAGAGIVADSLPALEAKETRNKARAALAAVAAARSALNG